MREAWIYGHGPIGLPAARMLVELGFCPRRVPDAELRPAPEGTQPCYPALVLLLVCRGDRAPQPDELLRRLRADVDLSDVPLVVAIDAAGAGMWIPAFDADEIIVAPLRIEELGVRIARARVQHGILTQDGIRLGSLDIDSPPTRCAWTASRSS